MQIDIGEQGNKNFYLLRTILGNLDLLRDNQSIKTFGDKFLFSERGDEGSSFGKGFKIKLLRGVNADSYRKDGYLYEMLLYVDTDSHRVIPLSYYSSLSNATDYIFDRWPKPENVSIGLLAIRNDTLNEWLLDIAQTDFELL